ncbi:MAG: NAD-dependent epimerase/dehydratase family protein [Planctomycetia bacterium]|nr:NAD-dependent epimerase/dehydratase family protein [Planctomycetia bacterium]
MRVLVTGGAGFIGSHVVAALLENGHVVHALDDLSSGRRENLPPGVPLHLADVRDKQRLHEIFDALRPDAVCLQAAQLSVSRSVREPHFDADVNLLGLLAVLENCVRTGTNKVVFASSGGVLYGDVHEPAPETTPSNPISPYGISKWCGEQYLQFFAREHGLRAVALRYSNVYGPRQNPHGEAGVVAIFAERLLAGQQTKINGDGRYVRDFVYAGDVARANLLALEANLPEAFTALNIGTGTPADINELASEMRELCLQMAGRDGSTVEIPAPIHGPPRAGDLRSSLVSNVKAREVLGWAPQVALRDGLRQTVEWFAGQECAAAM